MQAKYKYIQSSFQSWDNRFQEAADYAGTLGPDRVIPISHLHAHRGKGVVAVWYWASK